jgi:hypothetical protein
VEVDSREQRMMIRSEHSSTPIAGMLVQPVHFAVSHCLLPIPDEDIVEHQPRQRMKGMPPAWGGRWDAETEA